LDNSLGPYDTSFGCASDDKTSPAAKAEEDNAGCPSDGIPMADMAPSHPLPWCLLQIMFSSVIYTLSVFPKRPSSCYLTAITVQTMFRKARWKSEDALKRTRQGPVIAHHSSAL